MRTGKGAETKIERKIERRRGDTFEGALVEVLKEDFLLLLGGSGSGRRAGLGG